MYNNSYWLDRSRLNPGINDRSVSPYRVVRVSQSPNRQIYSPVKHIVQQPVHYQNHHTPSPGKIQYYPQSVIKTAPSQVYYATNSVVQNNKKVIAK